MILITTIATKMAISFNILFYGYKIKKPLETCAPFDSASLSELIDLDVPAEQQEPLAKSKLDGSKCVAALAEVRADWKFLLDALLCVILFSARLLYLGCCRHYFRQLHLI